MLAKTNRH